MDISVFIKSIKDPRRSEGKRYPFEAMMWMVFLSIASGYNSYRKIRAFCKSNETFLVNYFELKHGIPSHVSFFTLFRLLNSQKIVEAFNTFMQNYLILQEGDWIAGDGQALRSTVVSPHSSEQDYCALVSLFCQKTGLTIALQDYTNKKDGEIAVFLELVLTSLVQKGVRFTVDALHCQKKTLAQIADSGNHYVAQVKKNQPKLLANILQTEHSIPCTDNALIEEKKNGIKSTWQVTTYPYTNNDWKSIQTMVVVSKTVIENSTKINATLTHDKRYYVSDEKNITAQEFAIGIRGHWGIENKAHKPKDMQFNQDKNKIKEINSAVNRAILNTIALNFLVLNFKETIAYAQIIFGQTFKDQMYQKRT